MHKAHSSKSRNSFYIQSDKWGLLLIDCSLIEFDRYGSILLFALSKKFIFLIALLWMVPKKFQINELLKNSNYFKKWYTWNQWINIKKRNPNIYFYVSGIYLWLKVSCGLLCFKAEYASVTIINAYKDAVNLKSSTW